MPQKYTYLLVNLLCILFPFVFSFHPKIRFYKQWRHFVIPNILAGIIFVAWDVAFTQLGIWQFNGTYVVGVYLWHLPVEEYLFFFCIPYASVFTYYCIDRFYSFSRWQPVAKAISYTLIVVLAATAATHAHLLYTSVTFFSLVLFLALLLFRNATYMPAFYVSFVLILVPFFVSNGILTGIATTEPVVIYNNDYNLGIRLFTIPVEDTFYGMLLLLTNITGFEYSRRLRQVPILAADNC